MELSYKSASFAIKAMADDGSFEVYAAVFGNVDSYGDIIVPGAFKNLEEFVKDGWGAVNHNNWTDLGIATIDEATQDAIGLKIRGKFHSTPDAQQLRTKILERMQRGKSVKCSFGYSIDDCSQEVRDGKPITLLKALKIFEFSFVNLPSNPMAGVVDAKGAGIPTLSGIKALILATKAGRTLSAATIKKLKAVHDAMGPACADLKAFLDEHDPEEADPNEQEPDGDPDDKASKAQALAKLRLKARLFAVDPVLMRA